MRSRMRHRRIGIWRAARRPASCFSYLEKPPEGGCRLKAALRFADTTSRYNNMPIKTVEENRRGFAIAMFPALKLDALLVTSLHNVRYLTGFTGSNGSVLLSGDGRATLFTDPRYTVQSGQQVNCRVRIVKGPLTAAVMQEIDRGAPRRVGFEQDNVTVAHLESMKKTLPVRTQLEPV